MIANLTGKHLTLQGVCGFVILPIFPKCEIVEETGDRKNRDVT
jgi:hypothetical protein